MREMALRLAALRHDFGPRAARERRRLLRAGATGPATARALHAWHDEVLFCCAYPDEAAVREGAERELRRLYRVCRTRTSGEGSPLHNSGIAGTIVTAAFTPDLLQWLVDRHGHAVDIAWDGGSAGTALEELLSLLALPSETDGLLSQRLTAEQWVRHAAGSRRSGLVWLLRRVEELQLPAPLRDRLFASHEVYVRWRTGGASRTLTRFPPRPIFYQRGHLLRQIELGDVLRTPLERPVALGRKRAEELIDIARATLAARARETDPVTFANPAETTLFRLDRGVDVALFGMEPGRRLPIESYFGFVAARNRVPVAYGGGWIFFGRCEIGVNLFEEFRGGESAAIFATVLRTYRQHYRVRQFLVDPYQFGRDNTEAIRSGAFWFYYRLGFRPTDPALWSLADREFARIVARRGYRTPARMLRRFTGSKLFLDVAAAERGQPPSPDRPWHPVAPDLTELGLAVTRSVELQCGGDRQLAVRAATARLARLGIGDPTTRPAPGASWYHHLAPLVAAIPGLSSWPPRDRRILADALRAKGGIRERDYALRLQCLSRLRSGLFELSGTALQVETG